MRIRVELGRTCPAPTSKRLMPSSGRARPAWFSTCKLLLVSLACLSVAYAAPVIENPSRSVRECAKCHAAESKTQPLTSMAHAAETTAECSVLKSHALLKVRLGRYDYRIERKGDQSLYSITDGTETLTYPIHYAFGLGEAGQTYILEKDGEYYESFVSSTRRLTGSISRLATSR